MRVKPDTVLPSPSEARIARFEAYWHVNLPEDYRAFLREANGAIPIDRVFDHGRGNKVIDRMLCILDRDEFEALEEGIYDVGYIDTLIGERICDEAHKELTYCEVVPIATLFAGDFVCLDFRENRDAPVVVLWDHERSETFKPHFEFVDRSFTAFTSRLRPIEPLPRGK